MQRITGRKILFVCAGLWSVISSCRARNTDETSEIKWGHLGDPFFLPESPSYLINKPKGASYNVCLAKYMIDALPGIQSEIEAAVNIWAFYLGRTIPVAIAVKDLPRAVAGDTAASLGAKYNDLCGKGFDTVVGFAPLEGAAAGQTSLTSMIMTLPDGSKKMTSFQRYLFLRDFSISPDKDGFNGWDSYQMRRGKAFTKAQLLELMTAREQLLFSLHGKLLTLPTLTHEIGHIWGLCDQYEGPTNCDAKHSTEHKVLDSVMGTATFRERIFLTDDDIAGIRALGVRPGFQHDWPATPSTPVKPLVQKPVELFEKLSLTQANHKVEAVFALITNVPSKLLIEVKPKGSSRWETLSSTDSPATGFDLPDVTQSIKLPANDNRIYDVRLTLQINEGGQFRLAGTLSWVQ